MLGKIGYKVVKRKSKNVFMPCTSMALQKIKYKIGHETVQKEDEYGALLYLKIMKMHVHLHHLMIIFY